MLAQPRLTAPRTSRSVTALQMQVYMSREPFLGRKLVNKNDSHYYDASYEPPTQYPESPRR